MPLTTSSRQAHNWALPAVGATNEVKVLPCSWKVHGYVTLRNLLLQLDLSGPIRPAW